jgi:paraquat-inducible protein A
MSKTNNPIPKSLTACPECDLLLKHADLVVGEKAVCPRCGYLLHRAREQSIERVLALSVAGLVLAVPANFLPLIGIRFMGNSNESTLWAGTVSLFGQGLWLVAILVFLASICIPLLNTILAFLISAHLHFNRPHPHLAHWMRWLQHLEEWAMLEVYMLGIIVACVKLADTADVHLGFGLYAFVALLLVNAMLSTSLDEYLFWQRIDALDNKKHG